VSSDTDAKRSYRFEGAPVTFICAHSLASSSRRRARILALGLLVFAADIAYADNLHTWQTGNQLTASDLNANFQQVRLLPMDSVYLLSGSGTFNATLVFQTATASAAGGATYTNNGATFTVTKALSAGTELHASGGNLPADSGVLTRASGTGDATIAFTAYRAPLYLRVTLTGSGAGGLNGEASGYYRGGGGGGAGATAFLTVAHPIGGYSYLVAAAGSPSAAGSATTFGPASASGGSNSTSATRGGAGGGASGGDLNIGGGAGTSGTLYSSAQGGAGGCGGSGGASFFGSGGSGAGSGAGESVVGGDGFAYGSGGGGGAATSSGSAGGSGAIGVIVIEQHYQ
jgi:hypothetical protein